MSKLILLLLLVIATNCYASTIEQNYAYMVERNMTMNSFMMNNFQTRMTLMDNYSVSFSMMGKETDLFISFHMMSENRIAVIGQTFTNVAEMEVMLCQHNITNITMCSVRENIDRMMHMIMMNTLSEYMPKMQMNINSRYSNEGSKMTHEETYALRMQKDMDNNYNMVEGKGRIMQEGMNMPLSAMMTAMNSTSNIKMNIEMRTNMEPMQGIMQNSFIVFKLFHFNTEIMAKMMVQNLNRYSIESVSMKSNMEMINRKIQIATENIMKPMNQLTDFIINLLMDMRSVKTIVFSRVVEGMHLEVNYEINMINNLLEINFMLESKRIDFLSTTISFNRQKMNLFMMQKVEKFLNEELFNLIDSKMLHMIPKSMRKMEETLITPLLNKLMNKMETEMMNYGMHISGIVNQIRGDLNKFGMEFMKMKDRCQIMGTLNMTMMRMNMMREQMTIHMEKYMRFIDNMHEHMKYLMKFGRMENSSNIITFLMQMIEQRNFFADVFTFFRKQMSDKMNTTMAHMMKDGETMVGQISELIKKMLMDRKNDERETGMTSNSIFMNGDIDKIMEMKMKGNITSEFLLEGVKQMVEKVIEMREEMEEVERKVERMIGRIKMMMTN